MPYPLTSVSYTHLDVYKRQLLTSGVPYGTPESRKEAKFICLCGLRLRDLRLEDIGLVRAVDALHAACLINRVVILRRDLDGAGQTFDGDLRISVGAVSYTHLDVYKRQRCGYSWRSRR